MVTLYIVAFSSLSVDLTPDNVSFLLPLQAVRLWTLLLFKDTSESSLFVNFSMHYTQYSVASNTCKSSVFSKKINSEVVCVCNFL